MLDTLASREIAHKQDCTARLGNNGSLDDVINVQFSDPGADGFTNGAVSSSYCTHGLAYQGQLVGLFAAAHVPEQAGDIYRIPNLDAERQPADFYAKPLPGVCLQPCIELIDSSAVRLDPWIAGPGVIPTPGVHLVSVGGPGIGC